MNVKAIKYSLFFAVTILVLSALQPASAQADSGVTLTGTAGFDGYAKSSAWMPVLVQVENSGADLEARAEVVYESFNGDIVYGADVSLPSNSRKEFFIYFHNPQGGNSNLKLRLISNNKKIVETNLRVTNIEPQNFVVGLMSNTPSTFSILTQVKRGNASPPLAQLTPEYMPDRAQGLEALDLIIVSDTDTGALTKKQIDALELWLAKGGILFVTGGPKWQSTTKGVNEFLPIQISGTVTTTFDPDLSSLTDETFPEESITTLATGTLTKDAHVLAEQDGEPLLIERSVGRGSVYFFAADPALAPYSGWLGMTEMYQNLLGFDPQSPAWVNGKMEYYSANEAISTLAELRVPSVLLICGWLTLYIIAIGPVNYFVLYLLKKRELAWVTIPAIVIVMTAISYTFGFLYRGNTAVINRVTVIQAWEGVSQAESNSLVGVYSPQRKKYSIESGDGFLLYPFDASDASLQGTTNWLSIQGNNTALAPDIPIEIGGMEVVSAVAATKPLNIQSDLSLVFENGNTALTGEIRNESDSTIYGALFVTPGGWKQLGDLEPGKTVKIEMRNLTPYLSGPEFFTTDSLTVLGIDYLDLETDEEARRKNALFRAITTPEFDESNFNWGVYLMGWLNEPQSTADLQDESSNATDTTIYIHSFNPSVNAKDKFIKLNLSAMEWASSIASASPYYNYTAYTGVSEPYYFTFRPAIPIEVDSVQSMTLTMDSYAAPADATVSLWDYRLGSWSVVSISQWGNIVITEPERYVNQHGEVKLSIEANPNAYVEVRGSYVTLEVGLK